MSAWIAGASAPGTLSSSLARSIILAAGLGNAPAARQSVIQHLPAVGRNRVVAVRRGNAGVVLQHGIARNAVVRLGQIPPDRGDREPMAIELAKDTVMIRAPRQNAFL